MRRELPEELVRIWPVLEASIQAALSSSPIAEWIERTAWRSLGGDAAPLTDEEKTGECASFISELLDELETVRSLLISFSFVFVSS